MHLNLSRLLLVVVFVFIGNAHAQSQNANDGFEKYPVFPECEEVTAGELTNCFNATLIQLVLERFETPPIVEQEKYEGELVALFEVTEEGQFELMHVQAAYPELKEAMETLFEELPVISPPTYNGRPIYMQFTLPLQIPLSRNQAAFSESSPAAANRVTPLAGVKQEYDAIALGTYKNNEYQSQLNIPFSHQVYSRFDQQMNLVGTNSHTASKPYVYEQVNTYFDFSEWKEPLLKDKSSWFGKKFWNEHMVRIQGEGYWFTLDPAADLMLGQELLDDRNDDPLTYNNTRAVFIQGGLGDKFNFFSAIYESQGRFPDYFDAWARSLKPDGGNPAIVPGRGVAKESRAGDLDYPIAEGYLSYAPTSFFNLQFGHGKNFIGDGYRSLLLSDVASPYPYFKLNTTFWKLKYTNTWMSLRDVRPEVTGDGSFRTKYVANHYLSYNVSRRLNLGLFETVIWENDNDRGFDLNYLNPVIFYRAIEFSTGSRGGNALIGLSGKYKFSDHFNAYGQWIIDEFSTGDIFGSEQSYKNKLGVQLGFKYYDAFKIPGLMVQMEYNQVRPYVYSNNEIIVNYGHNNQSLAHLWGASFREGIAIVRYERERWYGTLKMIYGERGFEPPGSAFDFGASIYSNDENRPRDNNIFIGQGNRANTFIGDLELGYLINPATNLKAYTQLFYRDFRIEGSFDPVNINERTLWLNLGFRTDLFNWYFDY
ncbi:gliding motility protein RemB [Croceiramulus getboli]|nr:gliding motility protein RemB [Flavobacteriaceae bacterium YJPT1-3]